MIVLKEGTPQAIQLKVTYEGIPYEGPLAFGVLLDEDVVFSKQLESENGVVEIQLPKFLANDYEYIIETDEGYTDPKPFSVKRTLLGRELKKKVYPVEINKEWDENKDERQILESRVDEFYMKNGNRISSLEKGLEGKSKEREKKHEQKEKDDMERHNKLLSDIDTYINKLNNAIDTTRKEALLSITKQGEKQSNLLYIEASSIRKELTSVKDDIIRSMLENRKVSDSSISILEGKVAKIVEGIASSNILKYEVDDSKATTENIWTAFKVEQELRDRVQSYGKYASSQNMFNTIVVSGQDDIEPSTPLDELTLVAGSNMTITTDSSTNTITFASNGGGGGGTIDGSGTANQIPYWVDSDTLGSLTTATYPSLTELSYVKGVTSAIQTQLNAKGTGTVTSVAMTVPTGLAVSGTPITTTGTLALSLDTGYEIPLSTTISNKADKSGALTQFLGNGNWKLWYSDGSGDVQELALGADGTYLKSNGNSSAPSFATPAGGGTPGGSNTQFQYNNAGAFGGIAELTWNNTNKQIAFEAIDDTGGVAEWASYIHDTGESIYSYISHTRDVIEFLVTDGTDQSSFQGIGAGLSFSTTGYTRFNGNGVYDFKGTESQAAEARLYEDTDNGSNYVSLKAPTSIASSKTITLPDTTGTLALVTGTGDAITVGTIELGHASDTTIARASAGVASIEGNNIVVNTSSPTLATITTTGNIELGHASDTTLSRSSAGVLAVEGVVVPTISSTNTLTNKRIDPRITTITSSGTPTINTDNCDCVTITALAEAITSMTTNLSGTPVNFQKLTIRIKDNGTARAITWGSSFEAKGVALPTTTVLSKVLTVGFLYDTVTSKWGCIASAQEA